MKKLYSNRITKAVSSNDTPALVETLGIIIALCKDRFTLNELLNLSPSTYSEVLTALYEEKEPAIPSIKDSLNTVQWPVREEVTPPVPEETVFNAQIKELRKELKTSMKKIDDNRVDPRIIEVVTKSMRALRAELKLMIEVTDGETPSVTSMSDALDGDGDVEVEVAPVSEEEIVPADSTPTVSSHSWSALLMSDLVSAIEKPGFVTSGLNPSARKFLVEAVTSPSYAGMVDSYTVLSVVKTLATSNHRGLQNWVKSGGLLVDTAIKNFK